MTASRGLQITFRNRNLQSPGSWLGKKTEEKYYVLGLKNWSTTIDNMGKKYALPEQPQHRLYA